ncbi:hypothetical protein [Lacinutrix algicola]|uniref:hypothetical protein n=1 Tax=Lacinutrix algicola TaxID=342954 RepID=UPI0006E34D7E|nr:hypothetical protein [Lacinutrix algicola]
MENEIHINNIKIWLNRNVIYCDIYNDFDKNYSLDGVEDLFYEAISILSNETYLPVIFNFSELNTLYGLRLFRILSNSLKIENAVLSKVFLVKKNKHKVLLSLCQIFYGFNFSNLIFKDSNLAIEYSSENYTVFNSLSCDG